MSKPIELYNYIKLLSKNQITFFRIRYNSAEASKKKDIILLLDTILKQKVFDLTYLKNEFKGKDFARLIRRLYEILEDYMILYDNDKSINIQISLLYIKATKQKELGLFKRSIYLLSKAEKLAFKYKKYNFLAIILNDLVELLILYKDLKSISKLINKTMELFPNLQSELSHFVMSTKLTLKLFDYRLNKLNINIDDFFTYKDIEFLNLPSKNLSKTALEKQLDLKAEYFLIKNDIQKSYETKTIIANFLEHNIDENLNYKKYFNVLYNLLQFQIALSKTNELKNTFSKITNLINKTNYFYRNERLKGGFLIRKSLCQVMYFNYFKEFDKILKIELELNHYFQTYKNYVNITEILIGNYFLGIANFINKKYEKAEEYFYKIICDKDVNLVKKTKLTTNLLYLICVFEKDKKSEFTYSLLKNTKRVVFLNEKLETDKQLFKLISKLLKLPENQISTFKLKQFKLFKQISTINSKEYERFNDLGLEHWLKK